MLAAIVRASPTPVRLGDRVPVRLNIPDEM